MKQQKTIPFIHQKKKYQIGIFSDEKMINIVAFFDNHPYNCLRYQILIPKHIDVKTVLKSTLINHFVDLIKSDIVEDRWGNFLKEK